MPGALPVPVRLTICGLFPASSMNVKAPVPSLVAVGENVTLAAQSVEAIVTEPKSLLVFFWLGSRISLHGLGFRQTFGTFH